jgi:uncharacterized protein YjbI with pentapeptide repeats
MGADEDQSQKYDQAFFLTLAAKGKDAWNAWRHDPANKDVQVTFAGIDFSEAPRDKINFLGFEFGDHANFSQCKWRGGNWEEIQKDPGNFTPGRANFPAATFGDKASFTGAAFGYGASFRSAGFRDGARFRSAGFGDRASFAEARFGSVANFASATFGEQASFVGATIGDGAYFNKTLFKGRVEFNGMPSPDETSGYRASWWRDRFLSISFADARFDGEAIFSGRSFERAADFTNARFYSPPDFDAAANMHRIDFTGAYIRFVPPGKLIHCTKDSHIPVRLRAFRKIVEDTKNHDLERDLYIEERKAERGVYWHQLVEELKKASEEFKKKLENIDEQYRDVRSNWRHRARARNAHRLGIAVKIARLLTHLLWIVVMAVYWALADYGRSFIRPAAWLVSSEFFFCWCYTEVLAQLMAKAPDIEKYKQAVRMLALGNAVPFVGPLTIDAKIKEFLFCPNNAASCLPPIPPEGFQLLVIAQNLFSITCVFFIGLALRNYFRIK